MHFSSFLSQNDIINLKSVFLGISTCQWIFSTSFMEETNVCTLFPQDDFKKHARSLTQQFIDTQHVQDIPRLLSVYESDTRLRVVQFVDEFFLQHHWFSKVILMYCYENLKSDSFNLLQLLQFINDFKANVS